MTQPNDIQNLPLWVRLVILAIALPLLLLLSFWAQSLQFDFWMWWKGI